MKIYKKMENSTYQSKSQNIYTYMSHISSNIESPRIDIWDRSQPTNWILDSGVTCHRTPKISDFIPGSLVETDKYIEVKDRNFVTSKQTGKFQIEMRDDNGKLFIATLYNVLLAPDSRNKLFLIITLMNLGHIWIFHKRFCTFLFSDNKQNAVTLPHSAQFFKFLVKIRKR